MLLKQAEIKNFKSIENCKFNMDKGCRVFVGLSESGKSNLLYALSTLDDNFFLSKEYVKEGTRSSQVANVRYILTMTKDEIDEFYENIKQTIYSTKQDKFIKLNDKSIKLINFLEFDYVYFIDIRKNERTMQYYLLDKNDNYIISENHKFLLGRKDEPLTITAKKTGEQYEITERIIVNLDEYDVDEKYCEKITAEKLNAFFCEFGIEIAKKGIPNVLFWEYKDEFLLPSSIEIKDFIDNPDINIPLKYIFKLNDITDIKAEYNECKEMGEASFQNLLDEVSKKTNAYLKEVWKSMPQNCRLELRENADKINIRIKDANNSYLLNKRSDGFKRLITYMIMLSVKNKNNLLNNTLILIDEPETKIDIPGQDYLKLELINIGKNNYVYYSTHSTSMVDTSNIGRHYIVKKENECTNIEEANEDNYDSAMTLYKALGMQVYAVINDKNLVFEGWTDMHVFQVAINKLPQSKKNKFKKVGITHVPGATKFRDFASLWGLLAKEYYIISDADETSSNQKEVFEKEHYTGTWYKYDELGIQRKILTCEDFYNSNYIKNLSDKFGNKYNFSVKINEEKLNDITISKISIIEEWIKYNECEVKKSKELLKEFKALLAENVKKENITDDYLILLDQLMTKLRL